MFSSGRNQLLESLCAFGDITTRERIVNRSILGPRVMTIPVGKHVHDVFQCLRERIPSTTFLVQLRYTLCGAG